MTRKSNLKKLNFRNLETHFNGNSAVFDIAESVTFVGDYKTYHAQCSVSKVKSSQSVPDEYRGVAKGVPCAQLPRG